MDRIRVQMRLTDFIKKYRYAIIIILVGIILMCIPTGNARTKEKEVKESIVYVQPDLPDSLAEILSRIKGAGQVEVLLTEAAGSETLYQTNTDIHTDADTNSAQHDTVLIAGTDRVQSGLIRQVNPPRYQGAIVVCQGADDVQVRLAIVEAVKSVTGLGADHITVLKMK